VDLYSISELTAERARSQKAYFEFLRVPALSLGVYFLPVGGTDPQRPHSQDEVYYVVSGRGTVRVAGEDRTVGPGALVFVAAGVEHRFHTITEDLTLLVFFAPAESG
jgi:mannose-6-phosphate isomerase-like protein (cupin superfamily)